MPRLGFTPQTPSGSTLPMVTFTYWDAAGITGRLGATKVNFLPAPYWMPIAPSIYNDICYIDRLLEALS